MRQFLIDITTKLLLLKRNTEKHGTFKKFSIERNLKSSIQKTYDTGIPDPQKNRHLHEQHLPETNEIKYEISIN